MGNKIKIGILGVGHLGKIHLNCLKDTDFEIIGFYDPDATNSREVEEKFSVKSFSDVDSLLEVTDAIIIASPTITHFSLARQCINAGKHLFIEKPVTEDVEEAIQLKTLMHAKGVIVQVGHVERFNPAYEVLAAHTKHPMFIEGHRLAMFNPRGTDVSVVLDLMIHDLDIVLSLVQSEIKDIRANGVKIVSDSVDICNVRLEFENGCVANLTASRISLKNMRKIRVFEKDAYINADFLEKKTTIVELEEWSSKDESAGGGEGLVIDTYIGRKKIKVNIPTIQANNAIRAELESFLLSISNNTAPLVGIEAGIKSLIVAKKIEEIIDNQLQNLNLEL